MLVASHYHALQKRQKCINDSWRYFLHKFIVSTFFSSHFYSVKRLGFCAIQLRMFQLRVINLMLHWRLSQLASSSAACLLSSLATEASVITQCVWRCFAKLVASRCYCNYRERVTKNSNFVHSVRPDRNLNIFYITRYDNSVHKHLQQSVTQYHLLFVHL